MGRVTIEMPSGRWFRGEWAHRPAEGELVAAVIETAFGGWNIAAGIYRDGELVGTEGKLIDKWSWVLLWTPLGSVEAVLRLVEIEGDE